MFTKQEVLSKTVDSSVPLQGQEFYELRLFEAPNELGTRHGMLQVHAQWSDQRCGISWESEEVDYFWIPEEAQKRYAERRLALAEKGFIFSDMDW